jgi:signal transduction histidine kinase/DNA-binding response OmpR family regulator/HPt (histidine-containing phosphotransfer) domain-containing protein
MGISSFFFVSNIERKHLIKDAENALAFVESGITSSFLEYETLLIGYSEVARGMVSRGESDTALKPFIINMTSLLAQDKERPSTFSNACGYIFSPGGTFISGTNQPSPTGFVPQDQAWFKAAVDAGGKIAISSPSPANMAKDMVLTFSRYLEDGNGKPLGIFCLEINFEKVFTYAIMINLTDSSYGVLFNEKLEVIAHPETYLLGSKLQNIDSGIATLVPELEAGNNIYERKVKNYTFDDSIVYVKKINYDWFLGIIIPIHEYYKNVSNMAAFLILLGALLAGVLCALFYTISKAKTRSDMRTKQKSNFLATMSHEIRTPLNAILGMTEIQMQNGSHPPSTSEAFIKINNSGNLLLNIINDILDLSKIESGKLELIPVRYEVGPLINDIVQLNYIRYESKPIEFILEIDENIPSSLVGDELRIKQILNNLLSNAFKYTDEGKVVFSVNAECVGRGGGAVLVTLIFQVRDTGQGMTADQIGKLFDEYTRFNLEANRTTEGAGLGMTITRNLVDLMYGKINVKSAVGEGTTVTVRLPQKTDGIGIRGVIGKETAESLRQFRHGNAIQLKKAQFTHEYMPYGRILIVDDVETNLYVAKGLMVPYGLKIDLATSGFEALEKVKSAGSYDVIFMDHMMPKMDGIETTKRLRESGYAGSIVALTANALAGQAEIFLKSGFDGFISKPIDIRQLNVTLNKLIRDKQTSEVLEAAKKEKMELDKKQKPDAVSQQVDPELAEIFARDAGKAAAVLESCMRNNLASEDDVHLYIINVHSMKSALANIGLSDLSNTARRLEHAGRGNDINVMLTETNSFIENLRKVITELKPMYEDAEEAGEDTEESLAVLREKLALIKEACAELDKKSAKKVLTELRENTWSQDTKELLNLIAEHLLHSGFDDAAGLIDGFLDKTA